MSRLSIGLFVYNGAATIDRALASLRAQTVKDFELVILDGASKDGTLAIVDGYKDVVSKVISHKDNGALDAVNKSLEELSGDFIALLASDDWLAPDAVEKILAAIEQHPEAEVISYGQAMWRRDGEAFVCEGQMFCDPDDGVFDVPNAVYGGGINRAFHRRLYAAHGLYDIEKWGIFADRELQLRFALASPKKAVIFEPLYHFLKHGGSLTANGRPETARDSMYQSMMMAEATLARPGLAPDQRKELRIWFAFCWVRALFFLLRTGRVFQAISVGFKGVMKHPTFCLHKVLFPSMPDVYNLLPMPISKGHS